jgi:HK97 family phage prohead protease
MQDYLGDYTEVIRAGAFARSLAAGADVPFKVNHDGITLARTKSGTMRLAEDSTGLHVEADLDPASPAVQTLRSAMERGDLDEMSFAFRVVSQEWSPDWTQRDIGEVDLNKGDVSVVNYGANPHTGGLTSLRGLLDPGTVLTREALVAAIRELEGSPVVEPALEPDLSLYDARIRALSL